MTATIINLNVKKRLQKIQSVDLYHSWDRRLNNPALESKYPSEISYAERWYLHLSHILNIENFNDNLLILILSKTDNTLDLLVDLTQKDIIIHQYFEVKSHLYETKYNINRLLVWNKKFISLNSFKSSL